MVRPEPREVWWAQVDKVRICVVLRVESDFSEVVYGQTVHDPSVPGVLVKLGSFEGKRLRVTRDTSFRGGNAAMLADGAFKSRIVKPCPPRLFNELQRAVTEACASSSATTPTAEQAKRTMIDPSALAKPGSPVRNE
jgi:hypothetical protein